MRRIYANATSFYMRDLSSPGFGHLWGVLEPAPHGYGGMTIPHKSKQAVIAVWMWMTVLNVVVSAGSQMQRDIC